MKVEPHEHRVLQGLIKTLMEAVNELDKRVKILEEREKVEK